MSCSFSCRGGSRDERDSEAGITHLLEHLLFKRTTRHDTKALSEIIDALGGEINAITDSEAMTLIAHVPQAGTEQTLDFLSQLLLDSAFNDSSRRAENDVGTALLGALAFVAVFSVSAETVSARIADANKAKTVVSQGRINSDSKRRKFVDMRSFSASANTLCAAPNLTPADQKSFRPPRDSLMSRHTPPTP